MSRSALFEQSIVKVLEHEGGYVNHPADPGGETNMGITKRSYPTVNIKTLTVEQAKDIYYNDFWLRGPYEQLKYAPLAGKVFDAAVNMGSSRAFKLLQQAANSLGAKLVVDGAVGPKTLATVNSLNGQRLLEAFRKEQAAYYTNLVSRRPSLNVFLKGWLRRASS